MDFEEIPQLENQLKKLFEILSSPAKKSILNDSNHRGLIIGFIEQ